MIVEELKQLNLEIENYHGVETRTIFGLKSTNFTLSTEDEKIFFRVQGYGHGIGMSQTGADGLAKQGYSYEEILKHYYTGIEITKLNNNV